MVKPIKDQIACVEREIAMRKRIYPRWAAEKKYGYTPARAKHEIECMSDVLATLKTLEAEGGVV